MERTAKPTAGNLRYSAKTVRRVQTVSRARRKAKSAGTGNPQGSGVAEVTKGRWSGWRLAATVVAFTFRRAQSARVNMKRSNFMPVPETTEKPANSRNIWKMLLC